MELWMFFTKAGGVVAWIAFILGGLRAMMGFYVASSPHDPEVSRYLLGTSTGAAIDQGLYAMGLGIALGILTEISRSVARGSKE